MVHQMGDQSLEYKRIPQYREDVEEDDALVSYHQNVNQKYDTGKPSWENQDERTSGS